MIRDILVYPDEKIKNISANIRSFDASLREIIQDIKDTMIDKNLSALSAMQIGIQESVILLRDDDNFKEYINLRIINTEGLISEDEQSPYYGALVVNVARADKIKVIYEDIEGTTNYLDAQGELSRTLQIQSDYTFGATFMDRIGPKGRQLIEKQLEYGFIQGDGGPCPTVYYRDYLSKGINYLSVTAAFTLVTSFFISDEEILSHLYQINFYALSLVALLIISYFLYAQYEIRKFSSCTSCQTGNIFANTLIYFVQWSILGILTLFFVH